MSELTPKQQRFVDEYLIDLNGAQAAQRAGYSQACAKQQAWRLLGVEKVAQAVERGREAKAKRARASADRVIEELALIAFANAGDYFDWGPDGVRLKKKDELSPEQQAAVAEVVEGAGGVPRLKLHDKRAALADLGRHLLPARRQTAGGEKAGMITNHLASEKEGLSHLSDLERAHRIEVILIKQSQAEEERMLAAPRHRRATAISAWNPLKR